MIAFELVSGVIDLVKENAFGSLFDVLDAATVGLRAVNPDATPARSEPGPQALKGALSPKPEPAPEPQNVCRVCGTPVSYSRTYCLKCKVVANAETFRQAAIAGRMAALSPASLAREGKAQRRQARALAAWKASDHPIWLDIEFYLKRIQPLLTSVTRSDIASGISVSRTYASEIRKGKFIPHQRHWLGLAKLVDALPNGGELAGENSISP